MMNSNQMAAEVLRSMGGRVTKARLKAFQMMCDAIIKHIQLNMQVTAFGTDSRGDTVTTQSTIIQ